MTDNRLDRNIEQLIAENTLESVLAALCRYCNSRGLEKLFTKLDKVYAWLIKQ